MARVNFEAIEEWMAREGLRPADAARAFGVTTQRFNGWKLRGQVSADASDAVAQRIGSPRVSSFSATETSGDYLRVLDRGAEAGMGESAINDDFPEVIRAVDYTNTYIRGLMGFLPPPGRLALVTGRGDSMVPVIQPGESLLVDTGCTSFEGDGIYLINTGNGQQVKGLQDRGDAVYVVSANSTLYPAFPLPRGALVGGKVYLRNRIERFN